VSLGLFIVDVLLPAVALTWLFTEADGPWDVFARVRRWAGVASDAPGVLGKLLACGGCTAMWAGGVVGLVQAAPRILAQFEVVWWYPDWLAWLVRCPLGAVALVVMVDMLKPYPPTDLSSLLGAADEVVDGTEEDET
jgi:hypothetical protein